MQQIFIKKPRTLELKKQGFLAVDMHVHTNYSDSYSRVKSVLNHAKKKEVGIAITDHNAIGGALEAYSRGDVLVIPGIEVTTRESCHLLMYFYSMHDLKDFYWRHIEGKKTGNPFMNITSSLQEMVDVAKEYNALTSMAHPFHPSPAGVMRSLKQGLLTEDVLAQIPAVEVINGNAVGKMNQKAMSYAHDHNKLITAGSDAHRHTEVGSAVAYSESSDVGSFLDAVRKQTNSVVGKQVSIFSKMNTATCILAKHGRYFNSSLTNKYATWLKQPLRHKLPELKGMFMGEVDLIRWKLKHNNAKNKELVETDDDPL